jgi:hypothetical protein
MQRLQEEARRLDSMGKQTSDPFSKQKVNRAMATEHLKKACFICDKIFGEESSIMADSLLELGIFKVLFL